MQFKCRCMKKTTSARRMFTYFVPIGVVPHAGRRGKKGRKKSKKRDDVFTLGIHYLTTRRHQKKLKPRKDSLLNE